MDKPSWKTKLPNKPFVYALLWLIQGAMLIQAIYVASVAWMQVHFWESTTDEDIQIVKTKLIPHLSSNSNHYQPADVANMYLATEQSTRLVLDLIDKLLIQSALWLLGFIIVSLVMYWLFPNRRALHNP